MMRVHLTLLCGLLALGILAIPLLAQTPPEANTSEGAPETALEAIIDNETPDVGWSAILPGRGHSRPLVHGDRIYLAAVNPSPARQWVVMLPWAALAILGLFAMARHPGGQPLFDLAQLGERSSFPGGTLRAAIFGTVALITFALWRLADAWPPIAAIGQAGGAATAEGFVPPPDARVLLAVGALGGFALALRQWRRAKQVELAEPRTSGPEHWAQVASVTLAGAAVVPLMIDGPSLLGSIDRSWVTLCRVMACALASAALALWPADTPRRRRIALALVPITLLLLLAVATFDPTTGAFPLLERLLYPRFLVAVLGALLPILLVAVHALLRGVDDIPDVPETHVHPPLSAVVLVLAVVMAAVVRLALAPATGWELQLLSLDRRTGTDLRTTSLAVHRLGPWIETTPAAPDPITDGERIFVTFGEGGTYAVAIPAEEGAEAEEEARIAWSHHEEAHRAGPSSARFGPVASPVLFENLLILTYDERARSTTVALDAASSREQWRTERTDQGLDDLHGESTPIVIGQGEGAQLVHLAPNVLAGYDPRTGDRLWRFRGAARRPAASPVHDPSVGERGQVIVAAGRDRPTFFAAFPLPEPSARVELTWQAPDEESAERDHPGASTPIVMDGRLCTVTSDGRFSTWDPRTGERLGSLGLPPGTWDHDLLQADPTTILATSLEGLLVRIDIADPTLPKLAASRQLPSPITAPPVLDGDRLLVRAQRHLHALPPELGGGDG